MKCSLGSNDVPAADNQPQYYKIPNAFLRSAVFAAIAKGQRATLSEAEIKGQAGTVLTFDGEQFDQHDLDLFGTLVGLLFQKSQHDQENKTSCSALLRMLGVTDTGPNRTSLRNRLQRLSSCKLSVDNPWCKFSGSLIRVRYIDGHNTIALRLSPKINELYENNSYTRIQWGLRSSLRGCPLAQWLHGYYATHAKPHPVRIETLKKMSGSNTISLGKFRQLLNKALDKLGTASAEHGQKFTYQIDDELVRVNKRPSPSQERHLAKRQKRAVTAGKPYRHSG